MTTVLTGTPRALAARAAVADVLAVLVFALIGRGSHAEGLDPVALLGTAGPFLVALVVGWLLARAWRSPLRWPVATLVWGVTVVVGLGVRAAFTHRLPPTFVLITAVSLAVLLLGWRALALAVIRVRHRNA